MLKMKKISAGMIQIGGETAAFGKSLRNPFHVLGIQHPLNLSQIWTKVVDQGNGLSLSTSGNYHNPIKIDGRDYYHIIDPRTGYPASTEILSVSVYFPKIGKNWLADGLTTATTVLGIEKGLEIVENQGGEVLFLTLEDGIIHEQKSAGWDQLTR